MWERQQCAKKKFPFNSIHNNIINLFKFLSQIRWLCLKSLKYSSSFAFHHRHVCSLFFSYAIDFPMADWLLYVILVNAYINSLFISSFHLLTIFFPSFLFNNVIASAIDGADVVGSIVFEWKSSSLITSFWWRNFFIYLLRKKGWLRMI